MVRTAAELTLGREPDAVPKARRFVGSCLAGEAPGTVDAVALVVTELVTNALFHGGPPVHVRLVDLDRSIRVEVEDAGPNLPVLGVGDLESMTGRGLSVVAALSSSWGIGVGRHVGKVVWSEITGDGVSLRPGSSPEITPDAVLASGARHTEPVYTVRLPGIPTALLLAAKSHIDNLTRELLLLQRGEHASGSTLPPAMTSLIETVTGRFSEVRSEIKRQAAAAAGRGEAVVDLELHVPVSHADEGERYLAAVEEADQYARSSQLLTLAPPPSHRALRRWYVGSLVEQLRALGAGRVPAPPEPLAAVLAARLDEMDGVVRRMSGA